MAQTSNNGVAGIDNTFRRKFDREEYLERARERDRQVVTPVAPLSQQSGYYCSVCECVVKDSANYLDHINGKKHQRALGMSMQVERATLNQVKERFEILKKRKAPGSFSEEDLDERLLKQQQEEEERKRQRKEKKKEKKKEKAVEEEPEIDPDIAAMMGFGGFRSSKK